MTIILINLILKASNKFVGMAFVRIMHANDKNKLDEKATKSGAPLKHHSKFYFTIIEREYWLNTSGFGFFKAIPLWFVQLKMQHR